MNGVDRLFAIEDIKQLKARYLRAVDSWNWQALKRSLHWTRISASVTTCLDASLPELPR